MEKETFTHIATTYTNSKSACSVISGTHKTIYTPMAVVIGGAKTAAVRDAAYESVQGRDNRARSGRTELISHSLLLADCVLLVSSALSLRDNLRLPLSLTLLFDLPLVLDTSLPAELVAHYVQQMTENSPAVSSGRSAAGTPSPLLASPCASPRRPAEGEGRELRQKLFPSASSAPLELLPPAALALYIRYACQHPRPAPLSNKSMHEIKEMFFGLQHNGAQLTPGSWEVLLRVTEAFARLQLAPQIILQHALVRSAQQNEFTAMKFDCG